ncbi:MAG: DUF308 domain-containing protein [Butyrivibrio sp.]|jgi:uncharacterized membrane protein HdeD (DUF308 family)|nr:DUF308 domain-containing protein [Butyrivibrio sp.]
MNFFKRLGINYFVDAIICIAVGLILLFLPGVTMAILCKALAVLLIVAGAAMIISYLINKDTSIGYSAMFAVGLLIAIIGVWIFMKPEVFISLIPLIAGVIIVINGVTNFAQAISLARVSYGRWWLALVFALITIGLGIYLIFKPLSAVEIAVRIIGVILVYDGVSNVWVASRVHKFVKDVKQDAEAIDTEGKEV